MHNTHIELTNQRKNNLAIGALGLLFFLFVVLFQLASVSATSPHAQPILLSENSLLPSFVDATNGNDDIEQPDIISPSVYLSPTILSYKAPTTPCAHGVTKRWFKPLQQAPPHYS
ncbi:hypothetical protein WNY58_02335 [Neptuniibacter pectenicola]|jgi:hypothetical protein|uniref:Uncharacterized protein n=1 Tax=Neptuniibacter pectenicola TaxID=1806669 RepID=A0ABU9TNC7_9GAMM|nr:hypothetical protein [Neptuniibacter pectenicola]